MSATTEQPVGWLPWVTIVLSVIVILIAYFIAAIA
jgi:hypothetical protein